VRIALWHFFTPGRPKRFSIEKWKPPRADRLKEIAEYIYLYQIDHGQKGTYDAAVAAAAEEYGVSKGLAKRARALYRKHAEDKVTRFTNEDGSYLLIQTNLPQHLQQYERPGKGRKTKGKRAPGGQVQK